MIKRLWIKEKSKATEHQSMLYVIQMKIEVESSVLRKKIKRAVLSILAEQEAEDE